MALTAKKVYAILKRQISDMEAKLNSPVRYRGTVATADLLPLNPDIGDMYNIESKSIYGEAGMNVAWNGVVWDTMGAPIDMSLYIKSSELADWVKQQNKPTYTAEEVGALPDTTVIPSKTSDLQNDSGFLTKIPDNYLSGTDKTLSVSGEAADAKATGDKIAKLSADITKKLDKNQGVENSGKIAGINESGDIVPMFPVGVEYNSETNCLEFGSDQKMELNQGIGLDSTLTKTGYAADAGTVGEITNSLKEDISTKITKFYASSQGETHLADSDNGKIMDMMIYGKSEQKQYSGKNLLKPHTVKSETLHGVTCTYNNDGSVSLKGTAENDNADFYYFGTFAGTEVIPNIDKTKTYTLAGTGTSKIQLFASGLGNSTNGTSITSKGNDIFYVMYRVPNGITVDATIYPQIELGSEPTSYEPYTGGIPSPNPDYPQEIKSVVNPTVKVCGKNLLNATLQTTTRNGVTCTANGDGTYTLNGTTTTITTFDIAQDVSCSSFRLVGCPVGGAHDVSYELQARNNNLIYGYDTGDGKNIKADENFFIRIRINTGINCNNLLFKPMIVDASLYPDATYDDFEPYHEQTVALPYTLNAIPVSAGGNVTIDGQQYVSDYFDVERGKFVRMCKEVNALDYEWTDRYKGYVSIDYGILPECVHSDNVVFAKSTHDYYTSFQDKWMDKNTVIFVISDQNIGVRITYNSRIQSNYSNLAEFKEWLKSQADNGTPLKIVYALATPEEIDLAPEEITAFKALATYYPTTNISANSEQLDGYTVFNYPISMANGWNYVKKQLNDNRNYIYDMDTQSAEAYVNSEYAVALTELEV